MSKIIKMFDDLIDAVTLLKTAIEIDPTNKEMEKALIETIQLMFSDSMIEMAKNVSTMLDYFEIDREDDEKC